MFTAETLAHKIGTLGAGTFNPATGGGNIFVALVPDKPDTAITVTDLGGEHDLAVAETVTTYQIRSRAGRGQQTAARQPLDQLAAHLAYAGYAAPSTWAPGTLYESRVIYAKPTLPGFIGWDELGRPEWAMRVTVRAAA